MRNILVICNGNYPELGTQLVARLHEIGYNSDQEGDKDPYDVVCAIGGDGTILDAAEIAIQKGIPVFGINTGRVGFLAAFEKEIIPVITQSDIDSLYLSERAVLTSSLDKNDTAINEFAIVKENIAKSIEMSVRCNGIDLGVFRCDGILIATSTGSTAYNLAAGGPVMMPEIPCIVLTPICAFNVARRSIVLPSTGRITVTMSTRNENAHIISDGSDIGILGPGSCIEIYQPDRKLQLLLSHNRDTYELIAGTAGK